MRHEQSGERDITLNLWHRAVFNDDAKALDIDLQGRCGGCDQPLYVWEGTRSTAPKATRWLLDNSKKLNVPGYLIYYQTKEADSCGSCGRPPVQVTFDKSSIIVARVWQIIPRMNDREIGTLKDLQIHLEDLRASHRRLWHPHNR